MSQEAQILVSFVLLIVVLSWYVFFLPAVLMYVFGRHDGIEKAFQVISYLFGPAIVPMYFILYLGWKLVSIVFGIVVVILFAITSWLYVISVRFPFGGVFKALLYGTGAVLKVFREFMEQVGIKQIFSSPPPRKLEPLQS